MNTFCDNHGNFDKAEQRHAEKQVQVATDGADQRVHGHLGLLVHVCVGKRVEVEDETDKVLRSCRGKLTLIGAQCPQSTCCGELLLGIGCSRRIEVGVGREVHLRLVALERTARQSVDAKVVGEVLVLAEVLLARAIQRRQTLAQIAARLHFDVVL